MLLSLAGKIGSDFSIPSIVSMRSSFGLYGSYLLAFLNIMQLVGWATFEITILSKAAGIFIQDFISYHIWSIIFGIIIIIFGIAGPLKVVKQWLNKFAIWIVYGSIIVILINIFLFGTGGDQFNNNMADSDSNNDFFSSMDLVIAMPLSWLPLVADYNRFAKKSKSAFFGTFIGFSITNILFYVIGLLLGIGDVFSILIAIQSFFYGFILLILIVDEIDNVFANIFSSAMSFKNISDRINYKYLVIIFTAISCILSNLIPINQYESFLLLIGALFAPLFAIVLVDYYIVNRRKISIDAFYDKSSKLKTPAFISFLAGILTYFMLSPVSPFSFQNFNIGSTIPSMVVSVASLLSLNYIMKKVKRKKQHH
ncbi:MAG: cytosine permease [Thermoproteota archaeon]|nr:cytosine permease [Thermoproteota archaeon]